MPHLPTTTRKVPKADDARFQREMHRMGIVWAFFSTLPFIETLTFNAHASAGQKHLSIDVYIRMGFLFLLMWASMCIVFLAEKHHVHRAWSRVKERFRSPSKKFRENPESWIGLFLVMVLAYVIRGKETLLGLVSGDLEEKLLDWGLALLEAFFLWNVSRFLASLGRSFRSGMREAFENWGLSLRLAFLFYGLLFLGILLWVNFRGVAPPMHLNMVLSVLKDFGLLFIISNMLYLGLFKLARARALKDVFKNVHGFLQFVIACGIIAVLAVWADFRELDPARMERTFATEWQQQFMQIHIFVRDIFLLLLPITFLMFWTIGCVARELSDSSGHDVHDHPASAG